MLNNVYRKFKYEYYKLLRMKGAPSFVALGFALGMFIEFVTLPTFGIAFLLLFPLARLLRCSTPSAIVGFVSGKLLLPLFFIPIYQIGYAITGSAAKAARPAPAVFWQEWLVWIKEKGIAYLTGSAITGMFIALASYLVVFAVLRWFRQKKTRRLWGSVR